MYNRYIPQSDGSYQKNRMQDPRPGPQTQQKQQPQSRPQNQSHPQNAPKPRNCPPPEPPRETPCPPPQNQPSFGSVSGFLRQLLPKDFDTGDLLIVLLLLLMAGDQAEDKNTSLLTLALYLFM